MAPLPDTHKRALAERLETVELVLPGLYRLSCSATTEPYWARHAKYRFDAPFDPAGAPFGVLYAADSLDAAFCESVIHGSAAHDGVAYRISQADLNRRMLVQFHRPARPALRLADLTGTALKRMGFTNDVSASNHYDWTQQIAAWIWARHPDLDGIKYVSRQLNTACCYALFDRCEIERHHIQSLDPHQLTTLCLQFGVEVLSL